MAASRPRRAITAVAAVLVLVLVVAGAVTGTFTRVGHAVLYRTGLWSDGGSSSLPPRSESPSAAPSAATTPPVLAVASGDQTPDAKALTGRIRAVETTDVGGRVSALVESSDGSSEYRAGADNAEIPASTLKIVTTSAALEALGPDHRFRTAVTQPAPGKIVFVGGGDPYLCSRRSCAPGAARLDDLVTRTATALTKAGTREVALAYDASLFSGPAWNPGWPSDYRDQTTPTSSLWIDEGRKSGYSPGPRESDPARAAAKAFADRLGKRGIKVTATTPGRSPAGATEVAGVDSQPLSSIVEQVLVHSDNDGAEVLFRQVAVAAGRPGSIAEARKAVLAALDKLGVDVGKVTLIDGSGLSRDNRVSARTLVTLLHLGLSDDHPELRGVVTGLPVAGVSGSLNSRFVSSNTAGGRGLVHAKTGTLRKTHSLAGYVLTRDGSLVAFAFLVNDAKNDYAARVWLDRVSTAIATCGCRS